MKIELIRHGSTEYGEQKKYCGKTDVPLSEKGMRELVAAEHMPQAIYVSGAKRTIQTAQRIFPGADHRVEPELWEMDFGSFEGRTYDELKDDAAYAGWLDSNCESKCPGGEKKSEYEERVCRAFERIIRECRREGIEDIAIVAHGGTQMSVMSRFCDEKKDYYSWQLPYGGGYVLSCESNEPLVIHIKKIISFVHGG